jgi:GAF domain-containing protein
VNLFVTLFVKLNFACALAGLCTIAVGQSQSDVQRQYQEQQRQHQERQRSPLRLQLKQGGTPIPR